MNADILQRRLNEATVTLRGGAGRGVIVASNMVVTAAHCIDFVSDGTMTMEGDDYAQEIITSCGNSYRLTPCFADAVRDLAVLGKPESAELREQYQEFSAFCNRIEPLHLFGGGPGYDGEIDACLLDLEGELIRAKGTCLGARSFFTVNRPVASGLSGGPIVETSGRLVSVVSISDGLGDGDSMSVCGAFVPAALPVWLHTLITEGSTR